MFSSEMMPPGYNPPIRRDRLDGYGGVLLATKQDLVESEIKLETDSELVAILRLNCINSSLSSLFQVIDPQIMTSPTPRDFARIFAI